jgi:hypothetical protein
LVVGALQPAGVEHAPGEAPENVDQSGLAVNVGPVQPEQFLGAKRNRRRRSAEHGLEEFHVVCLDCLLEAHPEAGAGRDLAKRAGSSRFHVGIWMEEIA